MKIQNLLKRKLNKMIRIKNNKIKIIIIVPEKKYNKKMCNILKNNYKIKVYLILKFIILILRKITEDLQIKLIQLIF